MSRETGGDGGGKDKSSGEKAKAAFFEAEHNWHLLDFWEPDPESESEIEATEAIKKAFDDFMALLKNRGGTIPHWFSFEEFFRDRLTGDEEEKRRKKLFLANVIHDLEVIVLKADEIVKQIPQLSIWQKRLNVIKDMLGAVKMLQE